MAKFTKESGKFISLTKGAKLTKEYRVDQVERKKHKDPVMSQFFGAEKLQQLLSKEGAVGIRVYYGLDMDGDGKRDKKFIVVATDENGNDMLTPATRTLDKDTGPRDSDILTSEVLCPFDCSIANPLNSDTDESNG